MLRNFAFCILFSKSSLETRQGGENKTNNNFFYE